jgi:hypothetical protein
MAVSQAAAGRTRAVREQGLQKWTSSTPKAKRDRSSCRSAPPSCGGLADHTRRIHFCGFSLPRLRRRTPALVDEFDASVLEGAPNDIEGGAPRPRHSCL